MIDLNSLKNKKALIVFAIRALSSCHFEILNAMLPNFYLIIVIVPDLTTLISLPQMSTSASTV